MLQLQTILYVKCWRFVNPKWSLFATDTITYSQQLNPLQGVFNKDDYQMSVSLLANIQDMFEPRLTNNMLKWYGLSKYTTILAFITRSLDLETFENLNHLVIVESVYSGEVTKF